MLPDVEAFATEVAHTLNAALAPVLERLAAAEARLSMLGDLRDRVVTVEAKAGAVVVPVAETPINLTPILERLAAIDAQISGLGDLRDRVLSVEAKDLGAIRERLAVVETRAPIAGPAGADGQAGKDGADGLGFDELLAEHDGERTVTLKAVRGDRVKALGAFVFPVEIYRGVYIDGKSYDRGDCVTWGGSEWHCNEVTAAKPGEGSKGWTLKVKKGRDGKDGRDAVTTPVVSIARPS